MACAISIANLRNNIQQVDQNSKFQENGDKKVKDIEKPRMILTLFSEKSFQKYI